MRELLHRASGALIVVGLAVIAMLAISYGVFVYGQAKPHSGFKYINGQSGPAHEYHTKDDDCIVIGGVKFGCEGGKK